MATTNNRVERKLGKRGWNNDMSDGVNRGRRRFLGAAAITVTTAGQLALVRSAGAQSTQARTPTVPATKPGSNTSFGPVRQIDAGALSVGYAEAGPASGPPVILLHGWPYDIPKAELEWWYQYYFATDRGRAGHEKYRYEFAKLIWQTASPKWRFADATFDRSARAFDNPDHVNLVIHNYRWRLGLAEGESKYDDLEKQLATRPVITVPTITLEGDANGAPHPDPASYTKMFSGKYAHRLLTGGIGHNPPQEAPEAFAEAIVDVDRF